MNNSTLVVNCFQKSYLWLLNTTLKSNWYLSEPLWIAFKNLIFDYWTQHEIVKMQYYYRCELLSKILSLTIEHNSDGWMSECLRVVNCFQKSYLWLLNTTAKILLSLGHMLWIAFKNLIFDYWTQLAFGSEKVEAGCELLSKILSLTIEHNWFLSYHYS